MDELKPEDGLKPDPSDRHPGRSRQSAEFENEPRINMDDVEVEADDRRPARSRPEREEEAYDDAEEDEEVTERRPAKRKRAAAAKPKGPVSRQHIMMGVGVLVLLVLILGIGSALQTPSSNSNSSTAGQPAEKSVDLSGGASTSTDQNAGNTAPAAPAVNAPANGSNTGQVAANNNAPQELSAPPVSATPSQAQPQPAPVAGQQRVEVQGDLNNALTQQQGQIDNAVSSTLPTEPATVAPVNGKAAPRQVASVPAARHAEPEKARKEVIIEPAHKQPEEHAANKMVAPPRVVEAAPAVTAKRPEPVPAHPAVTAPAATVVAPAAKPVEAAAAAGGSVGNVNALKSAPGSHYTLQLSSSSNFSNLDSWAKKENIKDYVVYKTARNGQPWYVLVSGVYATRDDAKRAVAALPADVQAKNPWTKPIHQVQADLK